MPNYLKALAPFFGQIQENYAQQDRQMQLNREQQRRDEQQAYERKKYEDELKRTLEREKIADALKVLQATGEVPQESYNTLKAGGFGGMVQDTGDSQSPTVGPWGTSNIDTGGQGRRFIERKSPEQLEEEYGKRQDRVLAQQYKDAQTEELRRKAAMPRLIMDALSRNGGKMDLESMAPALMATGNPLSVMQAIANNRRQDQRLKLDQQRTAALLGFAKNRDARAEGKANAGPNVAQQRWNDQQARDLAMVSYFMENSDENFKEQGLQGMIDDANADMDEDVISPRVRDLYVQELVKKYGNR